MKRSRWLHKQLHNGLFNTPDLQQEARNLHHYIETKNPLAYQSASHIEETIKHRRSWIKSCFYTIGTLLIAIGIAAIIRQSWFELMEIPTGSMRPTFQEHDRVLVSKSAFGINIPFVTDHLYFDAKKIDRGSIVVFTADGLDAPDVDTIYFKLFPGKKRYVKRCVALPGDSVYFYGGDLFCVPKDSHEVLCLRSLKTFANQEYIPIISSFDGRLSSSAPKPFSHQRTIILKHFNVPIGRLIMTPEGSVSAHIAHENSWIPENSPSNTLTRTTPKTIGEFFGIHNFATCRLLMTSELPREALSRGCSDPKALCWLQLQHSPVLGPPTTQLSTSWIPLYEEHCNALAKALCTARFRSIQGQVSRYNFAVSTPQGIASPTRLPDGVYEFLNGKAYQIQHGLSHLLPSSHPLYPTSVQQLAFWFNGGIDFSPKTISPFSHHTSSRFAYFNNQALFVMGAPIFQKQDPLLTKFVTEQITYQAENSQYRAFLDKGPPSVELCQTFGFRVPEKHYLLLGDNPSMSMDSRFFGPVHEDNIQGTPIFLFWPFGNRWGFIPQPNTSISIYSLCFCTAASIGYIVFLILERRRYKRRLAEVIAHYPQPQTPT